MINATFNQRLRQNDGKLLDDEFLKNLPVRELLEQILLELRTIRTHQELITDETIKEGDL